MLQRKKASVQDAVAAVLHAVAIDFALLLDATIGAPAEAEETAGSRPQGRATARADAGDQRAGDRAEGAPTAASPPTLAWSAYCSHSYLSCENCCESTPLVSTIGWLVAVQPAKAAAAIPSVAATAIKRFIVYPFFQDTARGTLRPTGVHFRSSPGACRARPSDAAARACNGMPPNAT
jgi:hypothetical protein